MKNPDMRSLEYIRYRSANHRCALIKDTITPMLVLLYTYAAFGKLFDFQEFQTALLTQPFPHWAASTLTYLIPSFELFTVILLVTKRTERLGYWCSFVLMSQFAGYITLILAGFWSPVPCSCAGILGHLSWLPHLFFNLFFLIVTIAGIVINYKERREGDTK